MIQAEEIICDKRWINNESGETTTELGWISRLKNLNPGGTLHWKPFRCNTKSSLLSGKINFKPDYRVRQRVSVS